MNVKQLRQTPPWKWPEDAGRTLGALLADRGADPEDRLAAAELAGDYSVINDRLADVLMAVIGDPAESDALRATAAISLGPALEHADLMGFDEPDDILITEEKFQAIQASLRKLYQDDAQSAEVRRRILEASVRAPRKWHYDAVREAFAGSDLSWRVTALFCMGFIEGFDQQILAALGSEDHDLHYQAVCAAGSWELDDAWDHVLDLALSTGTEKTLRLAAIDAVAAIRPEEASMALTDLMGSDEEEIVEAVFEALAMSGAMTEFDESEEDDEDDDWIDENGEDPFDRRL